MENGTTIRKIIERARIGCPDVMMALGGTTAGRGMASANFKLSTCVEINPFAFSPVSTNNNIIDMIFAGKEDEDRVYSEFIAEMFFDLMRRAKTKRMPTNTSLLEVLTSQSPYKRTLFASPKNISAIENLFDWKYTGKDAFWIDGIEWISPVGMIKECIVLSYDGGDQDAPMLLANGPWFNFSSGYTLRNNQFIDPSSFLPMVGFTSDLQLVPNENNYELLFHKPT